VTLERRDGLDGRSHRRLLAVVGWSDRRWRVLQIPDEDFAVVGT
jgi:hypothetical protein